MAVVKFGEERRGKEQDSDFFWTRAVFKPLCTKTVANAMKTVTKATRPKAAGERSRARTIATMKDAALPFGIRQSIQSHGANIAKRNSNVVSTR